MPRRFKLPSALIMSMFCSATLVQADEQLLDGVRPFMCDGETVVLLETDDGWAITSEPDYKVSELRNGWQIGDQGMGFIAYLKEYEQDEWTLEVLSDDGYEGVSCIDLAEGVSEVVTAIKPRLDEAIVDTQAALVEATRNLRIAEQNNERLLEDHRSELGRSERQARVERQALEEAIQSKVELTQRIDGNKKFLDNTLLKYQKLLQAAVEAPSLGGRLLALTDVSPSHRYAMIRDSSLATKGMASDGLTPICIKLLSDKGVLNEACHQRLTEFVLLEGWN